MQRSGERGTKRSSTPDPAKPTGSASSAGWLGAVVLIGGALGVPAQAKPNTVSDAQVESNVLQALANNSKLAPEQISSTSVYGVVTLSGHVADEPTRTLAEDVVARTAGVTKVVDELTLGASTPVATAAETTADPAASTLPALEAANAQAGQQGSDLVLQSDGSYAPAGSTPGQPDAAQTGAPVEQSPQDAAGQPGYPQNPNYPAASQGQYPPAGSYPQQPGQPGQNGQPGQYGSSSPYSRPGQYGPPQGPPQQAYGQQPYAPQAYGQANQGPGQQPGVHVTIPPGTILQLRVNQPIDSRHSPVGSSFSGVLQQDIVVGGYVAIPRGAFLQGTVVDATSAGLIKGRAELGLQLTQLTLGGLTYPVSSNLWSEAGGDKAVRSVNSVLGLGVLGAIVGGVAGGGTGAAIGAGAGGAVGLGASAASGSGAVVVPPESLLTFHLNAPIEVTTVSQAELNRLAYNVPGQGYGPPRVIRRSPAYYPYGPGYYYPRYYRAYPY